MKKQIFMLLGVATLTYASANLTFVETAATLTAPTTYDIHYRPYDNPSPAPDFWELGNQARTSTIQDPSYIRSADGIYFNYTTTLDYNDAVVIPQGLEITMTFNHSNTNWTATGSGGYYPTDYNKIGSDNTVGPVFKKFYLNFNNQTNNDYELYLDISSTSNDRGYIYEIDAIMYFAYVVPTRIELTRTLFIPAFTNVELHSSTADDVYFDAWYLEDLGVSDAYNQGYEQGETDGYEEGYFEGNEDGFIQGNEQGYENGLNEGLAATPIENIFTAIFSGIANIFNIQIFGNITLGTIIIAPIAVALLWYILGIVSGVGGKK